jgi:protocatechuate 3,4-dioxygenase beta subunit
MTSVRLSRRQLLIVSMGTAGAWLVSRRVDAANCLLTPRQTEGPYYPTAAQIASQLDRDNDLTRIDGRTGQAKGQVLYIIGQVRDPECRPLSGATVEIWQASVDGRYNHPRDRHNPSPLDPNFQSWGRQITEQDGRYLFKTIIPGQYPAGPDWIRPSHVHFKIHKQGFQELITQMYFEGDPYLEKDRIFNAIPPAERERLVVKLQPPGQKFEPGSQACHFDLTLLA